MIRSLSLILFGIVLSLLVTCTGVNSGTTSVGNTVPTSIRLEKVVLGSSTIVIPTQAIGYEEEEIKQSTIDVLVNGRVVLDHVSVSNYFTMYLAIPAIDVAVQGVADGDEARINIHQYSGRELVYIGTFSTVQDTYGILQNSFSEGGAAYNPANDISESLLQGLFFLDEQDRAVGVSLEDNSNDIVFSRFSTDGNFDTAFGDNSGEVTTDLTSLFDEAQYYEFDTSYAEMYSDDATGIWLVTQVTQQESSDYFSSAVSKVIIMHFDPTGLPTSEFDDGHMALDDGTYNVFNAAGVDSEGNLFIIFTQSEFDYGSDTLKIAKIKSDGTFDETFGTNGVVILASATDFTTPQFLVVDAAGRITTSGLLAETDTETGYEIVFSRYLAEGLPDSTFGDSGTISVVAGSEIRGLTLDENGRVVALAESRYSTEYTLFVIRLTSSGEVDESFGTQGIMTHEFTPGTFVPNGLESVGDGRLLVYGSLNYDLGLFMLTENGEFDPAFGSAGISSAIVSCNSQIEDIAITADRQYIIAKGGGILSRFSIDGTLDTSYGTTLAGDSCVNWEIDY